LITFRRGGVMAPGVDPEINPARLSQSKRCWLELRFTNFDGTERAQSAELDCDRINGVVPEEYIRNLKLPP